LFNSLSTFDVFTNLPIGITKLEGVDNRQFLQGQLTCNLDTLSETHSQLGAHCDAKGKVLAALRLVNIGTDILTLQTIENTESHLPQLAKYAVFSKVTITNNSLQYSCTGLAGKDIEQWLTNTFNISLISKDDAAVTSVGSIIKIDDNPLTPRYLVVSNEEQAKALAVSIGETKHQVQPNELWFALDCYRGVAKITPATQGEFVPQMLNLQMVDAISFKKGCYIGQETVARMHFRGLNKRAMFILRSSSLVACSVGDNVEKKIGENWRNAGTIVSVQQTNNETIACAILPSDFELSEILRIKDGSDIHFNVTKPDYYIE